MVKKVPVDLFQADYQTNLLLNFEAILYGNFTINDLVDINYFNLQFSKINITEMIYDRDLMTFCRSLTPVLHYLSVTFFNNVSISAIHCYKQRGPILYC